MKHEERFNLALSLCGRMAQTYGDDLLLGGVYGSTARGTDTEWSDLEMIFVVADSREAGDRHFLYRDIAVGYRIYRRHELEEIVRVPTTRWPFHMGVLDVLRVLFGDPSLVDGWLRLGKSIPRHAFRSELERSLPGLVWESYGRILSCKERGNRRDIGHAAIEVLYEMNLALCLLNGRWVTHDYYQGLQDALAFPKLPERYGELASALWDAREIDEITSLAEELVGSFKRLLSDEGIELRVFRSADEIPPL
jgi:hypothetical protein